MVRLMAKCKCILRSGGSPCPRGPPWVSLANLPALLPPKDIPHQCQPVVFHIVRENLAGSICLRQLNLSPPSAPQTPGK